MQLKNILTQAAIILLFTSCQKTLQQRALNFNVVSLNNARQPALTFKVGDTVNFAFSGNPDHISFYSGEIGRKYSNIKRVSDTSSKDTLTFTTALNTAGSGSLQLLISTSFIGYTQFNTTDSANVISSYPSGWTDITSRANLATNATAKKSGSISLADYAKAGKPVYLAFRYRAESGVAQPKWTISAISLAHQIADTTYIINNTAQLNPATFPAFATSQGWGTVNVFNRLIKFAPNVFSGGGTTGLSTSSNAATASFAITGNTNAATSVATEDWIISGPIDLSRVLPDNGVGIKDMSSNASTSIYGGSVASSWASYTYKFMKKGTYNVTFLAGTDTKDGQSSLTRTITLTIQ